MIQENKINFIEYKYFICYHHLVIELNSKQRKKLEKLAHNLEPLVIVGGAGLTEGVEKKVLDCLNAHELVKVKFNEFQEEKQNFSNQIAKDIDATLVRIIGNVAIFYRQSDIEEKRHINV